MQEANIYFTVTIIDCFAFFLLHLLGWAAEKMRKEGMGKMGAVEHMQQKQSELFGCF